MYTGSAQRYTNIKTTYIILIKYIYLVKQFIAAIVPKKIMMIYHKKVYSENVNNQNSCKEKYIGNHL